MSEPYRVTKRLVRVPYGPDKCGYRTTDGLLWDHFHNAIAHQRWLDGMVHDAK